MLVKTLCLLVFIRVHQCVFGNQGGEDRGQRRGWKREESSMKATVLPGARRELWGPECIWTAQEWLVSFMALWICMTQSATAMRGFPQLLVGRRQGPLKARIEGEEQSSHSLVTTAVKARMRLLLWEFPEITRVHSKNVDEITKHDVTDVKNGGGAWHIVGTPCVLVP